MKKFWSVFLAASLALVVAIPFSTDATHSGEENGETIQEKLAKLDFAENIPATEISSLSDEMILELSKQEGEIISISQVEKTLDSSKLKAMSPSDFKMTVAVQKVPQSYDPANDTFNFVAEGDWRAAPFYEFTDSIALAWSDQFTLKSDYAYMVYSDGTTSSGVTTRSAVTPEAGVAYDVDLLLGKSDDKAILNATVYKKNSTDSANVVGEYGHVELTASNVDVSITGGVTPSVGMSVALTSKINKAFPASQSFNY